MNEPKYTKRTMPCGRVAYTVAGVVTTYVEQEAIDLTQTGVFPLHCAVTRRALLDPAGMYATPQTDMTPLSHGKLEKFPWE